MGPVALSVGVPGAPLWLQELITRLLAGGIGGTTYVVPDVTVGSIRSRVEPAQLIDGIGASRPIVTEAAAWGAVETAARAATTAVIKTRLEIRMGGSLPCICLASRELTRGDREKRDRRALS
jgi:hypothetical protein